VNNFGATFRSTPPVVKNLIILNVLLYLATIVLGRSFGINLTQKLAIFYPESELFKPFQFISHMFMHGGTWHLFFNMFALWMFGRMLETVWGSKRFFIYYFFTGLGAAALHTFVQWIEASSLKSQLTPEQIQTVYQQGHAAFIQGKNFVDPIMGKLNMILNVPTIGASGAVFGVLLGFGMLFPNTQLMLLFPPIPIRAKYFVIIYGILELVLAFTQPGSNIAHFAHLGGMIFGFILIKFWQKDRKNFY
jgi:membrane associated rhomboid family serine protease